MTIRIEIDLWKTFTVIRFPFSLSHLSSFLKFPLPINHGTEERAQLLELRKKSRLLARIATNRDRKTADFRNFRLAPKATGDRCRRFWRSFVGSFIRSALFLCFFFQFLFNNVRSCRVTFPTRPVGKKRKTNGDRRDSCRPGSFGNYFVE